MGDAVQQRRRGRESGRTRAADGGLGGVVANLEMGRHGTPLRLAGDGRGCRIGRPGRKGISGRRASLAA